MKTAVIFVAGRVQEVGYRTKIMYLAGYLGIDGCIKNLPDGRVKIVAQGSADKLQKFMNELKIKNTYINVETVDVTYHDSYEGFVGFNKIVGPNETDSRLDKAVDELKNVVTAIKEMNENMNTNFKEMNENISSLKEEVHSGNEELKEEIHGLREEIHGLRVDFQGLKEKDKTLEEIRELKTLLKVHLRIP